MILSVSNKYNCSAVALSRLNPLIAVRMASPIAVPCTGTDDVDIEFRKIFADM
jgi:hypothetical protein